MTKEEFYNIINSELSHDIFVAFNIICRIYRHPEFLHLNGYIYLPPSHPWYKKGYDDIDVEVHGGITYAELDKDTNYWCIGFDTNHYGDLSGLSFSISYDCSYRDWNYVKNEVENLAYQASILGTIDSNLDDIIAKKFLLLGDKNGF